MTQIDDPVPRQGDESPKRTLIRDLAVLQLKLIVDGFRDLILLPASIIAAIVSLSHGRDGRPGPQFYKLLLHGKQSEQFINLFGALRNAPPDLKGSEAFKGTEIDELFSRVETFVVEEHKRGGLTAQAKSRFDEVLRKMRNKNGSARSPDEDSGEA